MRAVVIHAPHDLRVDELPQDQLGSGQVRIAVERGGICGSDLYYYHAGGFGTVRIQQPMILGHEVSGRIVELGSGVSSLQVGQLVAVNPSRPCGVCQYCQAGAQNHCLDMRFYGSAMRMPHVHGAFRQDLVAEASQCHVVPDEMSATAAAMAEPLAVCLHATRQAGSLLGKRVLVTGSGPIGVLCAIAARRAGAVEIVATDVASEPLSIMRSAAADEVINVSSDKKGLKRFEADKGYFDVLFEASGNSSALIVAFNALKPGATIVQVGLGGNATLPLNTIVAKEFVLKGTFRFHLEFGHAVELMAKGLIDVEPLVMATLDIAHAQEAFELASDRSKSMKVHLAFA
ncbi:MAG: L-idonate 5-dehydrogenase [Hyphomicrobiaceae bacterium TMED74]|nr:L-idonate 5-dehydrogenase [Filomicrobium sp.]RPG44555.1 MAG: L-idonate 5-dehydrogenase [Hyphomicrobiaceae bacterium TMED74]